MRKRIGLYLMLVLALSMFACSETSMTFDIGKASKIELRSGTDGAMVEITNPEDIQYITENINSLTFTKGKSSRNYDGWSYSLKWYDSENALMEKIVVMSEYQIDYKDYFYKGMEADKEIDLSYFDRLLNPGSNISQENDDTFLKEPPVLTLSVNGKEGIETYTGSYRWRMKNDDGTFTEVLADSASVLQAQRFMTPITLDPKQDFIHMAELNFERIPDKIIVHRWSAEFWNKDHVNGEIVEVECVEPEPVPGYTGPLTPKYLLILQEGNYIYEVYAAWNHSDEYEGTTYYGFYTSTDIT